MKFLFIGILCTLNSTAALASANIDTVLNKVDEKLNKYEASKGKTTVIEKTVNVPWATVDKREAGLWVAIIEAYDHLRNNSVTDRYNFMYEAMRASSLGHPERIAVLERWLKNENRRLYAKGLHPRFYAQWKTHFAELNSSIQELAQPRPEVMAPIAATSSDAEANYNFLKDIKYDLEEIRVAKTPEAQTAPVEVNKIEVSSPIIPNYAMIIGGLAFLAFGFAVGNRKNKKQVVQKRVVKRPVQVVKAPVKTNDTFNTDIQEPVAKFGVNLEEECRKIIQDNSHLLEVAQLDVHPAARSPFKTTVNAPAEKVTEALNWLLKGTLAIANTNGTKVSHMEWNCKENSGRVSLEFVLHGLECDYKALYLNTLVEGDGSAPAHFGRSEMALEGHLPSVLFKSGNKRTTISLGLDSIKNSMNH